MIDFKKKDLFGKAEKKKMENFLQNVLIRNSELDTYVEADESENLDSFDDFDINSLMTDDMDFSSIDSLSTDFETQLSFGNDYTKEEPQENPPYEYENVALNILVSPYYLFSYMFKSIVNNQRLRNREDVHKFLNNQIKVSSVVLVLTLFLLLFTSATFIFSLTIQAVLSIVMIAGSVIGRKYLDSDIAKAYFDKVEMQKSMSLDYEEYENDSSNEVMADFSQYEDENDFGFNYNNEDFEDLDTFDMDSLDSLDAESDTVSLDMDEEDYEDYDYDNESTKASPFPHSPLDVSEPLDDFLETLESVYHSNEKYRGKMIYDRKELVLSLSNYLVANNKEFGKFESIMEDSTLYNNLLYYLYKTICSIRPKFKNLDDPQNRIKVKSVVENPLMYRIEIETNQEIQLKDFTSKLSTFEEALQASEDDKDCSILISKYNVNFVFKIMKPADAFVSLGDILRFHNDNITTDQVYDKYLNMSNALPLLLGLEDSEIPALYDFAENTSMVIAGESGSGKSWGTFLVMMNLIFTNSYHDVNFIIMDKKQSSFWQEFANLPHVIGYHYDFETYFDILKEINAEMEYRKVAYKKAKIESLKGVRKTLYKNGDYETMKAFPWLVVIIDEISNTQTDIKGMEDGANKLKEFDALLSKLAREGRSLGIKLIMIGQRTTAEAMPKGAMESSSMKFLFRLSDGDIDRGLGETLNANQPRPRITGQAIVSDAVNPKISLLKTLTVGGISDEQIVNIIRVMALDWTRRSDGDTLHQPRTLEYTYNRHIIREALLKDMEEGRLFVSSDSVNFQGLAEAMLNGDDLDSVDMNAPKKERPILEAEYTVVDDSEDEDDEERYIPPTDEELAEFNLEDFQSLEDEEYEENDLISISEIDLEDIDEEDIDFSIEGIDDEDDFPFEEPFDLNSIDLDSMEDEDFGFKVDDLDGVNLPTLETLSKDNSLSIEDFILKYGQPTRIGSRIEKKELEQYYDVKAIKRALARSEISLVENYYTV